MTRPGWTTQLRLRPVKLLAPERWAVYLLLCLLAWRVGLAQAAPGDLDTSFNGTGIVAGVSKDVIVLRNGRIVVASDGFSLTQYLPNGQLDTGFGTSGVVQTTILDSASAIAIAQQTDLKLVASGYATTGGSDFIALARYLPNGQPDTGFGAAGIVTVPGLPSARAVAIEALSDGRLLVAGYLRATWESVIIRFTATGTLDPTFGVGGIVRAAHGQARSMAVQPNGQILIAGKIFINPDYDYFLARYSLDGAPDPGFGTAGVMIFAPADRFGDGGRALAVQSDGKILMSAGSGEETFSILRFSSNGALDSTFGSNGRASVASLSVETVTGIAIQNDGKILATGGTDAFAKIFPPIVPQPPQIPTVARFNLGGLADQDFGSSGIVKLSQMIALGSDPPANAMILQTDGKILIAGAALARLIGDPTDATRTIPTLSSGGLALLGALMVLLAGWAARRRMGM